MQRQHDPRVLTGVLPWPLFCSAHTDVCRDKKALPDATSVEDRISAATLLGRVYEPVCRTLLPMLFNSVKQCFI